MTLSITLRRLSVSPATKTINLSVTRTPALTLTVSRLVVIGQADYQPTWNTINW